MFSDICRHAFYYFWGKRVKMLTCMGYDSGMNTSVLNDSRQLGYSGLTERLIAEKLVAASAAAEIGNQAPRVNGLPVTLKLERGPLIDNARVQLLLTKKN